MEAHASGVPAIVSNEGGPKEIVVDGATGMVLSSDDAALWAASINELLNDEPRRKRMSAAALERAQQFDIATSFERFWSDHVAAVSEPPADEIELSSPTVAVHVNPSIAAAAPDEPPAALHPPA
jgi:hypothetical protein